MDFVYDQTAATKLRVPTIVDTISRFSPAIAPPFNFRYADVVEVLERVGREVGLPLPSGWARAPSLCRAGFAGLPAWRHGRPLRPGRPTDNAFIGVIHGKFRGRAFERRLVVSFDDARRKMQGLAWRGRSQLCEKSHAGDSKVFSPAQIASAETTPTTRAIR